MNPLILIPLPLMQGNNHRESPKFHKSSKSKSQSQFVARQQRSAALESSREFSLLLQEHQEILEESMEQQQLEDYFAFEESNAP
jgi:hypothetical protein